MKKLLLSVLSLVPLCAFAEDFTTAGDGTTYTLQSLSAIESTGVTLESEGVYVASQSFTIANGDFFNLESGVTLKMADGVQIIIDGAAQFNCTEQTLVTRNAETDLPKGFYIRTESDVDNPAPKTVINNVKFEYAGVRTWFVGEVEVTNCEFWYNNGKNNSAGALSLGISGSEYLVKGCKFMYGEVPAIGVGANILLGLVIDDCYFEDNNTANSNKPQVNIVIGGEKEIVVKNSTFVGAQRTKVGALGISNMIGDQSSNKVIVEGNDIRGHRYGVTFTYGPMNIVCKNNVVIDNKYDPSPMAGGSGFSFYSSGTQTVYFEGNTVEDCLWGITAIGDGNYNFGKTGNPDAEDYNPGNNSFKNNGNGGVLYDLYNNSTSTIYAQGNTWGVEEQTAEQIETVIFHQADNADLGLVIYMPDADGIEDIEAANGAAAEYFNLQGVKVANPENGLFIKKQGNKAVKVIL